MSQHQLDLVIASPPLSTSESRPASSAASTCCGEHRSASATPWDSIIEEEVLRDLNLASHLQQQHRQRRRDLAQRLTRQYLQERQEQAQRTITLLTASSAPKRMKRKTRTPHRIVKRAEVAGLDQQTVSDPLSGDLRSQNCQISLRSQGNTESGTASMKSSRPLNRSDGQTQSSAFSSSALEKVVYRLRHRQSSSEQCSS